MPPLCFRMNGTGKLEEGIELEMSHPLLSVGKMALFFNNASYVLRNLNNGCLYQPQPEKNTGLVRRAVVEWKELEGKKPFPLLTRPQGQTENLLAHVCANMELPVGAQLKERFYAGIITTASVIGTDKLGREMLLSFGKGDIADVFYKDGSVKRVVRENDALVVDVLTIEDQADLRIDRVRNELTALEKMPVGDERAKMEDGLYHEVITILTIGGKRSSYILKSAFDFLDDACDESKLRAGVRARALDMLRQIDPAYALRFGISTQAGGPSKRGSGDFTTASVPSSDSMVRKGPPAARKAKLAERANRDREARSRMAGSSGGGKQDKGGNKKKGK